MKNNKGKVIMRSLFLPAAWIALASSAAFGGVATEIRYRSAADNTEQPAMFYAPETQQDVPLLVVLHTWSGDYRQENGRVFEQWCAQKGWAYLHPDFRGPNNRPEATGSALAVRDIVSAVEYACRTARIDREAVYLLGTSGGGHAALLMAGKHPELWAGVSAWAPIADLRAWYHETRAAGRTYYEDIAASCGGPPGDSLAVDKEYRERSPLTFLANAKGTPLHINTGIRDGHTGSVPVSHSLLAFNKVALQKDRISPDDIRYITDKAQIPEHLIMDISNPAYGEKQPLFRRVSGNAVLTLFDGGHECVPNAATAWIETVYRFRRM